MSHLHTVPDEQVTMTIDVSTAWEAKMAAIGCHQSQIRSSPILSMAEEKQRLFFAVEHFRLAMGKPAVLSMLERK
ncbi:MAG: hypothetical protein H5T63_05130 [Chloroflexi bacterium]|nr:hypothetical protein [Chloroflexota bacterium]